jgi:hypothetical protein
MLIGYQRGQLGISQEIFPLSMPISPSVSRRDLFVRSRAMHHQCHKLVLLQMGWSIDGESEATRTSLLTHVSLSSIEQIELGGLVGVWLRRWSRLAARSRSCVLIVIGRALSLVFTSIYKIDRSRGFVMYLSQKRFLFSPFTL